MFICIVLDILRTIHTKMYIVLIVFVIVIIDEVK